MVVTRRWSPHSYWSGEKKDCGGGDTLSTTSREQCRSNEVQTSGKGHILHPEKSSLKMFFVFFSCPRSGDVLTCRFALKAVRFHCGQMKLVWKFLGTSFGLGNSVN